MNPHTALTRGTRIAHRFPRAGDAAIDAQAFLARCLHDAAFALVLLDEFETAITQRIDELTLLSVSDELPAMAEIAHSLKGAASIVGAEGIRSIAAEIEVAGRGNEISRLPQLIQNLRAEIQSCQTAIPPLRLQLQSM